MKNCFGFLIAGAIALTSCSTVGAQTLYVPGGSVGTSSNGNVGIGTASPGAKLDVSGGDLFLRDVAGEQGYVLKSYGNANSFWIYPSVGSISRLVVGTAINWDRQIALEYEPGTTGAASGVLTIGQVLKNATQWTHGHTRFLTNGEERVRIDATGNVGIGTSAPEGKLHIREGIGTNGRNVVIDNLVSGGHGAQINLRHAEGSPTTPAAVVAGNALFNIQGWGYSGAGWIGGLATIRAVATENFSSSAGGTALAFGTTANGTIYFQERVRIDHSGNVGIGTMNPTQKLSVDGTVRAKEVIIEASPWPDDVFAPGYVLPTVEEVAAHIDANGHLPGVPSASTVVEEGVALGEMQKTLLRKVEELTLYVIQLERRNQALERTNTEIQTRLRKLEESR